VDRYLLFHVVAHLPPTGSRLLLQVLFIEVHQVSCHTHLLWEALFI
jgi:hypothetical protein